MNPENVNSSTCSTNTAKDSIPKEDKVMREKQSDQWDSISSSSFTEKRIHKEEIRTLPDQYETIDTLSTDLPISRVQRAQMALVDERIESGHGSNIESQFTNLQLTKEHTKHDKIIKNGRIKGEQRRDTTDSSSWKNPEDTTKNKIYFQDTIKEILMPVAKDSNEYNMNHPRRGYALIFNHVNFANEPKRIGSELDATFLKRVYGELGFEVELNDDLTAEEIKNKITMYSEKDHSDCDCIIITVLTHGQGTNMLHARSSAYYPQDLWLPFSSEKCLSLAGKPKIFIIQACRGTQLDHGVRCTGTYPGVRCAGTHTDSAPCSFYKLPSMADFLIAYSSYEGYYSWRDPEKGSWFIQSFCDLLSQLHSEIDLLNIMVRVSRKVATEFQSENFYVPEENEIVQVPNLHSTLIREIRFKPKE